MTNNMHLIKFGLQSKNNYTPIRQHNNNSAWVETIVSAGLPVRCPMFIFHEVANPNLQRLWCSLSVFVVSGKPCC